MFDYLRKQLDASDSIAEATHLIMEMASSPEDVILEDVPISKEEDENIKKILNKIPDTSLTGSGSTDLSAEDLKKVGSDPDPTLDELLSDC